MKNVLAILVLMVVALAIWRIEVWWDGRGQR